MSAIRLNKITLDSARVYSTALLDIFRDLKIDNPILAMNDTDAFPRLMARSSAEWMIGWFHGVAEVNGVTVDKLWEYVTKKGTAKHDDRRRVA